MMTDRLKFDSLFGVALTQHWGVFRKPAVQN